MEVENVSADLSDSQMDSLVNSETPSRDIPMNAPAPTPTAQEYAFKAHGKEIKAPIDKILQWASMGYEYPQKAADLNKQQQDFAKRQSEFDSKYKDVESKWAPYKEVDEFAAKNPDWWRETQAAYQQKMQGANSNPELLQLKQELAEIKQFRDEVLNEKKTIKTEQEDKSLASEVESIRKSFPNIDFDSPDTEGLNLEMRILKHASEIGTQNFRVAFRDYYHDHLLGKAREEGKESVSKEIQKRTKLGILGETPKPTKGLKPAENVKGKSYDQLMREGLDEIGA